MRNLSRVLAERKDWDGFCPLSSLYALYPSHTRPCARGLSPCIVSNSLLRLGLRCASAPWFTDPRLPFTKHVLTHLTHNPPQDRTARWVPPPF